MCDSIIQSDALCWREQNAEARIDVVVGAFCVEKHIGLSLYVLIYRGERDPGTDSLSESAIDRDCSGRQELQLVEWEVS